MDFEVQTTIRLKEDIRKMLEELAKEDERSLNSEVNYIIKKFYEIRKT